MKPRLQSETLNLRDLEKLAVLEAVRYTKGNLTFARELLNVSRATMYRLLREYGLDYRTIRESNSWGFGLGNLSRADPELRGPTSLSTGNY